MKIGEFHTAIQDQHIKLQSHVEGGCHSAAAICQLMQTYDIEGHGLTTVVLQYQASQQVGYKAAFNGDSETEAIAKQALEGYSLTTVPNISGFYLSGKVCDIGSSGLW